MATMKTVEGKTLSGEKRIYKIELMNAKVGTRIFHECISVLAELIPQENEDGLDLNIRQLMTDLPELLPWDKVEFMAKEMLSGGLVEIEGETSTMGPDGFGEYANGDPLEVYTALMFAIKANYPKYIDPLFQTLEGNQGEADSNSQSEKPEAKEDSQK